MANYSTYIPKGFTFRLKGDDAKKNGQLFDLEKFFRDMATRMGVSHRDPCCDAFTSTTAANTFFPVRVKGDLTTLQYFDPSTKAWVNFTI